MPELGFHSIKISACGKVVLNVGSTFSVKGDMQVTNGVLILESDFSSISLTIPKTHLSKIEIESGLSSVECDGIDADVLSINSSSGIKVSNSKVKTADMESELGSIAVDSCEFKTAKLYASSSVKAKIKDFNEIDINSEMSSVKFEYMKNELVYVECESEIDSVHINGLFCGSKSCKHKLYVSCAGRIDLISKD